jgi:hypothetical protein
VREAGPHNKDYLTLADWLEAGIRRVNGERGEPLRAGRRADEPTNEPKVSELAGCSGRFPQLARHRSVTENP